MQLALLSGFRPTPPCTMLELSRAREGAESPCWESQLQSRTLPVREVVLAVRAVRAVRVLHKVAREAVPAASLLDSRVARAVSQVVGVFYKVARGAAPVASSLDSRVAWVVSQVVRGLAPIVRPHNTQVVLAGVLLQGAEETQGLAGGLMVIPIWVAWSNFREFGV